MSYLLKDHTDRKKKSPSPRSESHFPPKLSVLFPTCSSQPSPTRPFFSIGARQSTRLTSRPQALLLSPPMGITPTDVYSKLVSQSRGSYCLETNCFLGYAFQSLGFLVDRVAAKIVCDIKAAKRAASLIDEGADRLMSEELAQLKVMPTDALGWESHQILLVALPSDHTRQYLADIGLAKYSVRAPILLSELISDLTHTFSPGVMSTQLRVRHDTAQPEASRWNVSIQWAGSRVYFPLYTFLAQVAEPEQIDTMHYFISLSPRSCGPPEMFVTMHVGGVGKVSFQRMELTIVNVDLPRNRQMELKMLENEQEQETCFKKYSGIEGYKQGALLVEV